MRGDQGRTSWSTGWGKKQDKAAREWGSSNRERRQERIRKLNEQLSEAAQEQLPQARNTEQRRRDAASVAPAERSSRLAPASANGDVERNRLAGSKSGRKGNTADSAQSPGHEAEGPYGTRVYRPNAPAEWEQPLDGTWLEAWPQPVEKDPELEWKNSPNPWRRLEEATGNKSRGSRIGGAGHSRMDGTAGSGGGGGGIPGGGLGNRIFKGFSRRLLISTALFAAVWGMFQMDGTAARHGQALVREALSKPMNMAAIAGWYEGLFGAPPSFIPGFGNSNDTQPVSAKTERAAAAPVEGGSVVRSFAELLGGVEISGQPGAEVRAAEEGRVLLVSAEDAKGPTVVLQHANGRTTYYAQLGEASVAQNDWVQAGEAIGRLGGAAQGSDIAILYFAVKEQDQYIDPAEVVPLD
ncbi:M23 family metallopeptidase [Paenibacillus herberti]|uniref:M23ase beta-sheet core domain-containing protein n=1 Tax=Paenibacillus herberti TaxID=1619309 RepID=A0A229NZN7_9BACL|nr:M23 family metallopeptidase [Paenibacillus herberti]OXM15360.1 hypothetical protein CGZ75_01030 [Paenibacillus herberti]